MTSVTIRWCNKILLLFLVIISIFIHVLIIVLSIDMKKLLISLKIVTFAIFQSINCGIMIIFIKPIILHQTFDLFYTESLITVLDRPNLGQIIWLSFSWKARPTQTEIMSRHIVLYSNPSINTVNGSCMFFVLIE